MTAVRDRRVTIISGTLALAIAALAAPAGAQSTSCLDDIERWMREYQARHHEITGEVAEFPECCPDSRASAYPKDDYYDDTLRDNPAFAVKLVKGLRDAMLARPRSAEVYQSFLAIPVAELDGRPDADVPMMSAVTIASRGVTSSTDITAENFCDIYGALRDIIRDMKTRPLVSPTNEPCFLWTEPPAEPGQANCVYRGGTSVGAFGGQCSNPPYCECDGDLPSCPNNDWLAGGRVFHFNDCPHSPSAAYGLAYSTALCVYNYGWQGTQGGAIPAPHAYVSMSMQAVIPDAGQPEQVCYGASVAMETWRGRLSIDAKNRKGKLHIVSVMTGDSLPSSAPGEPAVTAAGAPVTASKLDGTQRLIEPSLDINQSGVTYSPVWGGNEGGNGTWGDCSDPNNMPSLTQPCLPAPTPGAVPISQVMSWAIGATSVYITPDYDTRAEDQRDCSTDCGTCVPGEPKPGTKGLNTSFPLGMLPDGTSAGYIALRSDRLTQGCYPQDLIINVPDSVYRVTVEDIDNRFCPPRTHSIRQLYTGDILVEVLPTPCEQNVPCGFQIQFKKVGPNLQPDSFGQYTTNQPAFHTSCIKHVPGQVPDPNDPTQTVVGDILRIESTKEGVTKTLEYVQVGDDWMLRSGFSTPASTPIRAERILTDALGNGDRQVTQIVSNASGTEPASRMVETRRAFAWGEELIERRVGTAGSEQTETYSYYSIEPPQGQTDHNYGRLKSFVTNTGNWRHFEYDARGRVIREIAQFKDGALNAANASALNSTAAANREIVFTYLDGTDLDGDSVGDLVVERVERLLGVAVARSYTVTWSVANVVVPGGSAVSAVQTWEVQCASPTYAGSMAAYIAGLRTNNAWRTGTDRVAATWREAVSPFRTLLSQNSSGSMTWTVREDLGGGGNRTTTYSGLANTTWDGLRAGTGTRSITEKNAQRVTVLRTLDEQDTAGSWVRTSKTWVVGTDIDQFNRVLVERFDDTGDDVEDARTTWVYSCCGLQSETSRDGITTTYGHDALGRTIWTQTPLDANRSIRMTTVYDAMGNVLSETRTPYGGTVAGTPMQLSANTYDLAGRLVSSTNGANATTTFSEQVLANPARVVRTQTLPDPDGSGSLASPVIITTSWPDGSPMSVGGTGAHPESSDSGVAAVVSGTPSVRFTQTSFGAAGSRWTRSFVNALGQTTAVLHSDGALELMVYNNRGEVTRRIDADGYSVLSLSGVNEVPSGAPNPGGSSAIDWSGRWSIQVQDNSAEGSAGVVDWSDFDRIRMSTSKLATRTEGAATIPVRRTTTLEWSARGDATAVVVTGVSESTLDGRTTWRTSFGRTTKTQVTITPSTATREVRTTLPSGVSMWETTKYGRPVATERRAPGLANVFAGGTTTVYDDHGRVSARHQRLAFSESQDAVTEYQYDDADRVVLQIDPRPATGEPRRNLVTTYDALSRVVSVLHRPDQQQSDDVTNYKYAPTGELIESFGFGVTPVRYGFDEQGRMETLTTFKDYAAQTGLAVTTWTYHAVSGRMERKTYEDGTHTDYAYTIGGRLFERTWARGVTTRYGYDGLGALFETEYSDGTQKVSYAYDRRGRPSEIVDAAGVRTMSYTDDGQLAGEGIVDHQSSPSLLRSTEVVNSFDSATFLRTQHTASALNGGPWTVDVGYGYDDFERPSTVTMRGITAGTSYSDTTDRFDRTSYYYMSNDQPVEAVRGQHTLDALGRLTKIAWTKQLAPTGTLTTYTYDYDVHGRRTARGLVGKNRTWFEYDSMGQLVMARQTTTDEAFLPGSRYEYGYDDIGNRTSTAVGGDPQEQNLATAAYSSNSVNQYTSREVPGQIDLYGWSPASAVLIDGNPAQRFSTSPATPPPFGYYYGQRTTDNSSAPKFESVRIQDLPGGIVDLDFFVPKDPETFTYDADGNLTRDGIWHYEWDAENRLKAMQMTDAAAIALYNLSGYSAEPLRIEFAYDYLHRRISKRVMIPASQQDMNLLLKGAGQIGWSGSMWQKFIWDGHGGWGVLTMSYLCDSDGNYAGPDRSYAWGPDLSGSIQGAGGISGLAVLSDDLHDFGGGREGVPSGMIGPMVPIYDGNGNLMRLYALTCDGLTPPCEVASYEYGPFGEIRSLTGIQGIANPFRFSTKFTDGESGLVYYGYRYYHAGLGRWVSRDPIEEAGNKNLYAAVGNNPLSYLDADGRKEHIFQTRFCKARVEINKYNLKDRNHAGTASGTGVEIMLFLWDEENPECKGCNKFGWIQVFWQEPKTGAAKHDGPHVDTAPGNKFPYYHGNGPEGDDRSFGDWPFNNRDYQTKHDTKLRVNFQLCLMCKRGSGKHDAVLGCIEWGYVSGRKKEEDELMDMMFKVNPPNIYWKDTLRREYADYKYETDASM